MPKKQSKPALTGERFEIGGLAVLIPDEDSPNFLKRWKEFGKYKDAHGDTDRGQFSAETMGYLTTWYLAHVVEPVKEAEAIEIIDTLSANQHGVLQDKLLGVGAVDPTESE